MPIGSGTIRRCGLTGDVALLEKYVTVKASFVVSYAQALPSVDDNLLLPADPDGELSAPLTPSLLHTVMLPP